VFHMVSYLLDVIYTRKVFASMNLSWHVAEIPIHIYFKILWEKRYKKYYTLICDEFITLVYFIIFVITKISSANGYKSSASPNSYEVTHGPKLPQKNFQRVKNYTNNDKIKVRYNYTGHTHTCTKKKCRKSTHALDARLWSLKATHI
jgi:hypothetical protein